MKTISIRLTEARPESVRRFSRRVSVRRATVTLISESPSPPTVNSGYSEGNRFTLEFDGRVVFDRIPVFAAVDDDVYPLSAVRPPIFRDLGETAEIRAVREGTTPQDNSIVLTLEVEEVVP